jgi:hypothetical protein
MRSSLFDERKITWGYILYAIWIRKLNGTIKSVYNFQVSSWNQNFYIRINVQIYFIRKLISKYLFIWRKSWKTILSDYFRLFDQDTKETHHRNQTTYPDRKPITQLALMYLRNRNNTSFIHLFIYSFVNKAQVTKAIL